MYAHTCIHFYMQMYIYTYKCTFPYVNSHMIRRGRGQPNKLTSTVRKLVSQVKRRCQEHGFDLDLSYITKQLIAMGLPSSGEICCSMLQCGAVWCSVVRCGTVWCSVVQCDVVWCCVVHHSFDLDLYICIYMYVYMYIYTYMYTFIYIYIYVFIYIYTCIHTYIHTHIHT